MKMTRLCKIALTAVVSIGLACGAAQAKEADDLSVYNWGPWGKMITPAAGAPPAFVTQLPEGFDYQSALNPRLVVPATVVPPVVVPVVEPPPVEPPPVEPPIEARHHNRHREGHGNNGNGVTY